MLKVNYLWKCLSFFCNVIIIRYQSTFESENYCKTIKFKNYLKICWFKIEWHFGMHKTIVWCGVVLCCVVWCGVVWCGLVWCCVVWYISTKNNKNQSYKLILVWREINECVRVKWYVIIPTYYCFIELAIKIQLGV